MDTLGNDERRRLVAESARKQLADGTWPEVMMVFSYANHKAPLTTDEEFARLKSWYEQAACPSMAQFVDLLRFAEKVNGTAMSYNFSMRRRLGAERNQDPDSLNSVLAALCPDVLVGTRRGVDGAAVWLAMFAQVVPNLAPESVQVMDKVFGEALVFLRGTTQSVTFEELLKAGLTGEGMLFDSPAVSKH